MMNEDIISMPDKWEYPWYAAWDLAFHTLPLSIVDPDFAKEQLDLMLRGTYLHPNGQMPAYEWNFSDVNPPVHAWATLFLHRIEQALRGEADLDFLKPSFGKLLLNFTWWVNRKDRFGKNVFEGGFLGLDNIGVFDRSAPLPTGGYLEQADGTAWMALFSQNMLEIAVELAAHDPTYQDMVVKFVEHFFCIAAAMNGPGTTACGTKRTASTTTCCGFPTAAATRLKVRSMVGLLPLCATTVIEKWQRERVPQAMAVIEERLRRMPELTATIHPTGPGHLGVAERGILALVNPERLRRILTKMLDENEFLSPYGIRSLSKFHERHPYVFHVNGQAYTGGLSARRVGHRHVRRQLQLARPDLDAGECAAHSGAAELLPVLWRRLQSRMPDRFGQTDEPVRGRQGDRDRLTRIFLRDEQRRRAVYGGTQKFQHDPHWRDHILFYEYFHGDNGAGLGASHQTGWTGLVAKLIQLFGSVDAKSLLEVGKAAAHVRHTPRVT